MGSLAGVLRCAATNDVQGQAGGDAAAVAACHKSLRKVVKSIMVTDYMLYA